jgi:protein SCO1
MARTSAGPALAALGAATMLVATLGACGSDQPEIIGLTRSTPLSVAGISAPDVAPGAPDRPAGALVAAPGGLVVATFGFTTCPDVCPTTMALVVAALDDLGTRSGMIEPTMVTVDRERDTPDAINSYLGFFFDEYRAIRPTTDEGLVALQVPLLASSVVRGTGTATEVDHTAVVYVIDDKGDVLVEWSFGTSADVMASDLAVVLDRIDELSDL